MATKMASWEARRSTAKRSAVAAAIAEVQLKTHHSPRWHMREPAGFDESWQQYLQPGRERLKWSDARLRWYVNSVDTCHNDKMTLLLIKV